MEKRFYQLTTTSLPIAVAKLAEIVVQRGQTLEVVCPNSRRKNEIEEAFWEDSEFLPHSVDEPDGVSKILISEKVSINSDVCFLLDDVDQVNKDSSLNCFIFHNVDQDVVKKRRMDWVEWTQSGELLTFWAQSSDGVWNKRSESNSSKSS